MHKKIPWKWNYNRTSHNSFHPRRQTLMPKLNQYRRKENESVRWGSIRTGDRRDYQGRADGVGTTRAEQTAQKTNIAEQNDHKKSSRIMLTHGLEVCGRGKATTDQGGGGGMRKPCGVRRMMMPGGPEGARSESGSNLPMSCGLGGMRRSQEIHTRQQSWWPGGLRHCNINSLVCGGAKEAYETSIADIKELDGLLGGGGNGRPGGTISDDEDLKQGRASGDELEGKKTWSLARPVMTKKIGRCF